MEDPAFPARQLSRPTLLEAAEAHYDAVFRFCARQVGEDAAADLAQETFLTAHRAYRGFRGDSALKTWLFGIALNECRRYRRRSRTDRPLLEFDGPADSPEAAVVARTALEQALRRLSDEHREAVLLHEMENLTYEEMARVLAVPVGTAKSRLHHAMLALRRALFPAEVAR